MFDPGAAECGGGGVLAGGGIPEFHRAVLSAGGEQWGRGGNGRRCSGSGGLTWRHPSQGVRAANVAGKGVMLRPGVAGEERDGSGGGGGSEQRAVGRPGEINRIVVERRGPVLGEVHGAERLSAKTRSCEEWSEG